MLALFLLFFSCVLAINLFIPDGQRGPLLGTYFGAPGTNATFDYVVVGGGTAGLTLATRLSANKSLSVAVVEAGGFYEIDNHNYTSVPGYASYYTGADPKNTQPLIDWGFVTTPQLVGSSSTGLSWIDLHQNGCLFYTSVSYHAKIAQ